MEDIAPTADTAQTEDTTPTADGEWLKMNLEMNKKTGRHQELQHDPGQKQCRNYLDSN